MDRTTFNDRLLLSWLLFGALFGFAGIAQIINKNWGFATDVIYAPLWLCTYFLVIVRWGIALPHRLAFALLFLSFLSCWFSLQPAPAFIYWLQLLASALVFTVANARFGKVAIIECARDVISLMLILSLVLYALHVKGSYIEDDLVRSNWLGGSPISGIFSHKIYLAIAAALGVIIGMFIPTKNRFFHITLALFCLSLTQSASVSILLLFVLPLGFILKKASDGFGVKSLLLVPGLLGIIGVIAISLMPVLADILGRDLQGLTGRSQIWETAFAQLRGASPLGLGYEVAARDPMFISAFDIVFSHNYRPPHLHNSYVQFLINLGPIGLTTLLALIAAGLWATTLSFTRANNPFNTALWTILALFCALALIEHVFTHNYIGLWILLLGLNETQSFPTRASHIVRQVLKNQSDETRNRLGIS